MTITHLTYTPKNDFIHHWLAAGPRAAAASKVGWAPGPAGDTGVSQPPVDQGALAPGSDVRWRYFRSLEDHWVDFTTFSSTPQDLTCWAYTRLIAPGRVETSITLTANVHADLWIDGEHRARLEKTNGSLQSVEVPVSILGGGCEVLIRTSAFGQGETPIRAALKVNDAAGSEILIALPVEIEAELIEKRLELEEVAEAATLDRYIYGYLHGDLYDKNEPITVSYSSDLARSGEITHRLQSMEGDIFQESTRPVSAGATFEMAKTFPLRNGPHHLAFLPPVKEYYVHKMQFNRKDLFFIARTRFDAAPVPGSREERARQALEDAALRRNETVTCELAKMALGQWDKLNRKAIEKAVSRIQDRSEGSVVDMLAVLSMLARFENGTLLDEFRPALASCVLNYRYWHDQPGDDGMDFDDESRQILFHTCEILAGQAFPRRTFENSGQNGQWHRQHGETMVAEWIRRRGAYGFEQWNSPSGVEMVAASLAHLVDLAVSDVVRELAVVLLDKVFFNLALHSFRGIYGSSRGHADTPGILSPRLEATSGITRMMWGTGNFNENYLGAVSLALCPDYDLPPVIEKIATQPPESLWARARSCRPGAEPAWEANHVTYATRDFMLSSAQDYYPGRPGKREHIWQASMGPDAIVYTNHPANMLEETTQEPNLWAGNAVLPRVAQWGDVLFAIYRLPKDDWMGFTHAYFPTTAFDEFHVGERWAFARKGEGYLALHASQGLQLITTGKTALRELRSYGLENVWVCHMGHELIDGSFDSFQQKIQAMDMVTGSSGASMTSLRGEELALGWEGPLRVNGEDQELGGFKQYETPFCVAELPAQEVDIVYDGEGIRLTFD